MEGSDDHDGQMLWPFGLGLAPAPHHALPENVREDYVEARSIVDRSPRGAAALLRLAVQKLMPHLGEPGKDLNKDIGSLVAKGLDVRVQQALDSLRVIGNNAVHPGELDLKDNADTAQALFAILNYIVEQLIEMPKRLQAVYESLRQEPSIRSRSATLIRRASNARRRRRPPSSGQRQGHATPHRIPLSVRLRAPLPRIRRPLRSFRPSLDRLHPPFEVGCIEPDVFAESKVRHGISSRLSKQPTRWHSEKLGSLLCFEEPVRHLPCSVRRLV
ncbi:MAG TPA: DUF4145 domain-containing protein [Gaiellaceae bacterium]|jgi:hypothetical protein